MADLVRVVADRICPCAGSRSFSISFWRWPSTSSSAESDWVNWEVERSLKLDREVVAFHKGDQPPKQLPRAVKENEVKVLRWADLARELEPEG